MKIRDNIQGNEWSYCLSIARNGRALILKDSESFGEASRILEKIGKVIGGKIQKGLGGYKFVILELMSLASYYKAHDNERLFNIVKDARNLAVHEGSFARQLSGRLIDIFLYPRRSHYDKNDPCKGHYDQKPCRRRIMVHDC